jgi:hypothetical protein
MSKHQTIIEILQRAGAAVRDKVYAQLRQQDIEVLSTVYREGKEDTIYQIDRQVEEILLPVLEQEAERVGGFFLMAEGIGDAETGIFLGVKKHQNPAWAIIIDPIDGTRGIMYNKRPGFFLAGAAPWKPSLRLSDIEAALMTELPTGKMLFSDCLFAINGKGAHGLRYNLVSGHTENLLFRPSQATHLRGGFAQIARFFSPGREILARIDDALAEILYPDTLSGRNMILEDQYISTGGQLYEMLMGHDRFVADIRDLLYARLAAEGKPKSHTCHPYDICMVLIAKEAGLEITDSRGRPFDAPFNLLDEVGWIAYANKEIRHAVEPVLLKLMKKEGLI